jgi:hypothetical protein
MLAITPGDRAAAQLRAAGVATDVLPWPDLLHEGPVPAGLEAAALARVRAGYIRSVGWPGAQRAEAELIRRDEVLAEAAAKPVEIVLWFDHNLVNRLALLQVLDRLAQLRGPGLPDVTLAEPHGFGDADADALSALSDRRTAVTGAQLEHARGAWAAFRAPDPTGLVAYTQDRPLAGLGAALALHLTQFPALDDGLAGTERRALQAIADGVADFAAVYRAVTVDDDPPWLGDSVLRSHLARLSTVAHPLLDDGLRLTDDGRAVLAGRADHVVRNGVDHWLGGVHLTGATSWRYDPESGRPVRSG